MKLKETILKIKDIESETCMEIVSGFIALVVMVSAISYAYFVEKDKAIELTKEGYAYEGFDRDYLVYLSGEKPTEKLEETLKCTGINATPGSEASCYFQKGTRIEQVRESMDTLSKGYIFDIIEQKDITKLDTLHKYKNALKGIKSTKDREKYKLYYKEAFLQSQKEYKLKLEAVFTEYESKGSYIGVKETKLLRERANYLYDYGNLGSKDIQLLSKIDNYILKVKEEQAKTQGNGE